jgi:hypothetical protein
MRRTLRTVGLNGVTLSGAAGPALAAALVIMFVLAVVLLAAPSAAFADDSGVSVVSGQGVFPLASSDIRMESETVQAICYRNFAEYLVEFKFVNEGPPQTLQLGFSSAAVMPPEAVGTQEVTSQAQWGGPVALRAWQEGKPLQVTFGQGKDPMESSAWVGYYLHTATFPHGETTITVSYVAGSNEGYQYWLHTGAYWKGPIGKAIVRYRLADSFHDAADLTRPTIGTLVVSPNSYVRLDDRTYQWVFDNLEPTAADDINMRFISISPTILGTIGGDVPLPASAGAVVVWTAASNRLGPNVEIGMQPGWEAVDGQPSTAWGFSAKAEYDWLQMGVRGNQHLAEIRILPGRNDSPTSFTEYARPKKMYVSWADGQGVEISLKDEPSLQRFPLTCTTNSINLLVEDVYPGTKSNDVYISEIDLGNAPAPEFDTYANMMAGGKPPTTEAVPALETSTTNNGATTSAPSTTSSAPITTTTAATPSATTGGPASPGGSSNDGTPRLVWAVILVAVVAAAATGVSIYFGVRLRRRGKTAAET